MSEHCSNSGNIESLWHETLREMDLSDSGEAWHAIESRYQEAHRQYHTLTHISQCLDLLRSHENDNAALRLAIFYHDVIYDTHRQDNESQSAIFAEAELAKLQCSDSLGQEVSRLIRATAHLAPAGESDESARVISDIDLATLGSNPAAYDIYSNQIRREYEWVPREEFRVGRSRVLQSFLDQAQLYRTEEFRSRYEVQARANLLRELDQLAAD